MTGQPRTRLHARLPGASRPMHRWRVMDGLYIAGDTWGNPRDPLVILLHGGGQTRHAWKGAGAMLGATGCHAIALDARGHGDSDWSPAGDYSAEAMVRDLQSVVEALGGRPPVLIGASVGGVASLIAAGERSVAARALVLVDMVPRCEPLGVERVRHFMEQGAAGFASLEEAAAAISRYRGRAAQRTNLQGLAKNLRRGVDGRFYWHWDPLFLDGAPDPIKRYEHLSACARQLQIPVLLARGAASDVVTEEGVKDFLALCPHAETIDVANASHMVAGDQNDAFGLAVSDFLRRSLRLD